VQITLFTGECADKGNKNALFVTTLQILRQLLVENPD
jgi:hypothetical protein